MRSDWLFIFNGGSAISKQVNIFHKPEVIDKFKFSRNKIILDSDFLNLKYVKEGLTSSEIARLTFSSRTTVNKKLKEFGIRQKGNDESRRRTGGYVYGFKNVKGKSVLFKKENNVIVKIIKMRRENYSYQKIALWLNSNFIENKSGKYNWSSKMVRDIYLRESKIS